MSRRTISLPLDHLDAELVAAPFADLAGFGEGLVALDPRMRQPATVALWRSVERRLAGCFPGVSLDELIARRDRAWFGGASGGPRPLGHLLESATPHVGRAGVMGAGPATTRQRLRWLTFALPSDLISAFSEPGDAQVPVVAPAIARLLAEGLVEPHLHLGAALDFETIWITAQHAIAARDSHARMFESPGAVFDDGRLLAGWLVRALIVRAVLAQALALGRASTFRPHLDALLTRLPITDRLVCARVFESVARGQVDDDTHFVRLRGLYRALVGIGPGAPDLPRKLDTVADADGIRPWFGPRPPMSSEQCFMRHALPAVEQSGQALFATLFWQVVRIRVLFYRHLVQRPMVGGLQWFTRTFARIGAARGRLAPRALVEGARRMGGPLTALELRFKPERAPARLTRQLAAIAGAGRTGPDLGLILHLTRSRGPGHRRGAPAAFDRDSFAEPGQAAEPFRFAAYYRARRREARAIIDVLRHRPGMIELIRGIDICGDELGVPLWVLAPLLRAIVRVGRRAAVRQSSPTRPVDPIRLMVHAGEDYVHLLGGLRRIDDFVEYLDLGEGDRVAHALALGEDVQRWSNAAFGRLQGAEERLLDLLWAWRRLQDAPSAELATWGSWLEAQIRRLSVAIFGDDAPTVEELVAARRCLHNAADLDAMGFPDKFGWVAPPDKSAVKLAQRWISDRAVFRRGRVLIEVDPRQVVPLIEHLQRRVRYRLSARSVVIEVNPSSNLLIGSFADLGEHPLWRLRPVEPNEQPSLMVTIGSDDPLTFATTLPAEYQLVHDTLVLAGVSSNRALDWLDAARRTSLRTRVALSTAPAQRRSVWPETLQPLRDEFLPG